MPCWFCTCNNAMCVKEKQCDIGEQKSKKGSNKFLKVYINSHRGFNNYMWIWYMCYYVGLNCYIVWCILVYHFIPIFNRYILTIRINFLSLRTAVIFNIYILVLNSRVRKSYSIILNFTYLNHVRFYKTESSLQRNVLFKSFPKE